MSADDLVERLRATEARLAAALAAEAELRASYAALLTERERDEQRHADELTAVRRRAEHAERLAGVRIVGGKR